MAELGSAIVGGVATVLMNIRCSMYTVWTYCSTARYANSWLYESKNPVSHTCSGFQEPDATLGAISIERFRTSGLSFI